MAKAIDTLSIKLDFKAGSGSQQIIDKIGNSIKNLKVIAGQTGPSVEKVRRSINDFAKQGNKSISTIEGQVTALRALRREADINSKEFKELTADIAKYERQLNKAQGRRGGGARQATQVAGAVVSGGIFGGPEGALGALGGFSATKSVEGAFAGAAFGAQVNSIRKAIGAAADYAAQIQKLEIGLRGVVSSESEFHQAIAAANSATKDFNISAVDAISGITKLSAAVIGAGGNVTDVETVFRGISAAVLATGGSADDVRASITAMVQVFSKGKVSAEELSGQLGERLPGAVVRFAKAAFGTGPEAMQKLQKELKAGTVGLNELMLFASDTGLEFEDLAKKIAGSSASAGARLNILVDAFRLELGTAIQPIGAQIQDFAGEILVEFKDEIIAVVKELGNLVLGLLALAKFVGDNKEIIGFFAGLALKIKAAQLAIAALAGIKTSFAGVVAAGTSAKITGDVAKTSAGKVTMLKSALSGLAAIGIVTVGIDIFIRGMSQFAKTKAEIERLQGIQKDPSAQFKGKTKAEVEKAQAEARELLPGLKAEFGAAENQPTSAINILRGAIGPLAQPLTGKSNQTVSEERAKLFNKIKALERTLTVDSSDYAVKPKPTVYNPLNPDGGGTGGGTDKTQGRIDRADEIVRRLQDQLRIQKSQGKIGQVIAKQAKERSNLEAIFQALLKDGVNDEITKAQTEAKKLLAKKQSLELEKRTKEVIEKSTKPLEDITKNLHEKIRADKQYARLIKEGVNPELAKQLVEIEKQFLASRDLLDVQIEQAKASLSKLKSEKGTEEAIRDQIKAIEDLEIARKGLPKRKQEAEGAAGEAHADETFLEGLDSYIGDIKTKLDELTNPLNQVKAAAEAIGAAFQNSFKGLINGSMTAREAMASFFQSIADHFADMAAQIAAEALKLAAMKFVQMILSSFAGGAIGSGTGAPVKGATAPGTKLPYFGPAYAEGGFIPGGFKAYNKGGVVSQPTLGLVGEGGESEYIIPASKMTQAMSRYSRGARGAAVIPDGSGGDAGGEMGGGGGSIDVSYSVERINNVNYVTAAEFERGMNQAAKRGAELGRQGVYSDLVNKRSIRSRIGV